MDYYDRLRKAVFDRFSSEKSTWEMLASQNDISVRKLRTAYKNWISNCPESQPETYRDIHLQIRTAGRPCAFPFDRERVIAQAILYYADNSTPLSREGVMDLVQVYVSMLPNELRLKAGFVNNRPSKKYVENLLARHGLKCSAVRQVEDNRVDAITTAIFMENIAPVQAVMNRYNIHDPKYIFNMDQSGSSFEKIIGSSLRKGVGLKGKNLKQRTIGTKGNLNRVTIMPVVSAAGKTFTPCLIFPGKTGHYRAVRGQYQTLQDVLMDCKLYHRDPAGADSAIIFDWATHFVKETDYLRANNQCLLLLLDGYADHLQYRTLDLFKRNNIVTVALPAHSSHELQPLDVTVFGAYKSFLQRELHRASQQKKKLNAFDIASIIHNAYSSAFVGPTIASGFIRCGLWSERTGGTDPSALRHLFVDINKSGNIRLDDLLSSFMNRQRSLLRDVNVEHEGRIRIDTKRGAHVTSDVVLAALKKRDDKKKIDLEKKELSCSSRSFEQDYKEPSKDIKRLGELSDMRSKKRKELNSSRDARRKRQKMHIAFHCAATSLD